MKKFSPQPACRFVFGALLAVLSTVASEPGIAGVQSIVYPADYADQEGPTIFGTSNPALQSTRHQWIYPASAFPLGMHQIEGLSFRADRSLNVSRLLDFGNVEIKLARTSANSLSTTFANNFEEDPQVVFDSDIELYTEPESGTEPPYPFDYTFQFDEPFAYSPAGGDGLLVDFTTSQGLNLPLRWDAHFGSNVLVAQNSSSQSGFHLNFRPVTQFLVNVGKPDGDFDHNGILDAIDIDLLTMAIGGDDLSFDVTGDGMVGEADRDFWVTDLKKTWFGDSNLDREFNSGDFVQVFAANEYEDEIIDNSTWATGDWNGDADFDSGDFVLAFSTGGYEQGPRVAAAVPEPCYCGFIVLAVLGALPIIRSRSRIDR